MSGIKTYTIGNIGALQVRQWSLSDLRISYLQGEFQQGCELEGLDRLQDVGQWFVLKGGIRLSFPVGDVHLGAQMHTAVFPGNAGLRLFTEALVLKALVVQYEKAGFLRYAREGGPAWQRFADAVEGGLPGINSGQSFVSPPQNRRRGLTNSIALLFDPPPFINLAIQSCIQQILHSSPEDHLFIRSKALELMALQAACLAHSHGRPTGYLAEARLEMAKEDLIAGRKSATEIAFALGYSSLQHFSTAFKKRYGVSPSELGA